MYNILHYRTIDAIWTRGEEKQTFDDVFFSHTHYVPISVAKTSEKHSEIIRF